MNRFVCCIAFSGIALIAVLAGQMPSAFAVDVTFQGSSSSSNFSDAGSNLGNEGYWFANFNRTGGINTAPPTENAVNATPSYVTMSFGAGVDSAGGWGGYTDLTLPDGTVGNSGCSKSTTKVRPIDPPARSMNI